MSRLCAIVTTVIKHRTNGLPLLVARIPMIGRKDDESQRAVVGHVVMRSKDVDTVEETCMLKHLLEGLANLSANVTTILETPLPGLHFTAQVGACIEPEASGILDFVPGAIQVMEAIRQPIQRIRIGRRCLARL